MEAKCGFCGSLNSQKRCSRCKTVMYCNREHQTKHWKTHKMHCVVKQNEDDEPVQSPLTDRPHEMDTQNMSIGTDPPETLAGENYQGEVPFDERPFKRTDFPQPKNRHSEFGLSEFASECLKSDGYCVIDNVIPQEQCEHLLKEVDIMNDKGLLKPGKLAGGMTSGNDSQKLVNESIRNDRIAWVEGTDSEVEDFPNICNLMGETMDIIVAGINTFFDKYILSGRTKAMIACYPGNGTAYKRHVDNPSGDGRLITCIVYLNKDWNVETQGGLLRIFPSGKDDHVDIEPIMGRMLLFWSDSRNPHEVQPAYCTRYAITIWYFEIEEREKAKEKELSEEIAQVRGQAALTDVETKRTEKEIIEKKIACESTKAFNLLTEDELEAICTVVGDHPNPRAVLTTIGIAASIQEILLPEIQRRITSS